jgi:glycosyltransferase involved in cell wall biosynthesis
MPVIARPPASQAGGRPEIFTLLVDCLPMLPGGENGGAKWAAIGIIAALQTVRPRWRIILLCSALVTGELRAAFPTMEIVVGLDDSGRPLSGLRLPRLRDGQYVDAQLCPFVGPQILHADVPVLSIVYDIQFRYYPNFFAVHDLNARARNILATLGQSDRIVCASEAARQSLLEFYEYDSARIRTIPLRLADRLPQPERNLDRRLEALGQKPQGYLLYPANTWLHKNHAMLLTGFALYCRAVGQNALRLVCTGTGNSREDALLREAVHAMGLNDAVSLLGFLPETDLATLLSGAYALLFPSLFEGFGMPILEAMQCGVPVLCGDVPSLRELAGDAAMVFDNRLPGAIAKTVMALQADSGRRAELIARGRIRARDYSDRAAMGEAFAAALEEMAGMRQTVRRPAGRNLIAFGQEVGAGDAAILFDLLGDGWSAPEEHGVWGVGERSILYLPTETAETALRLTLDISPLPVPGKPGQRLALFINGESVGEWMITGRQKVTVEISASHWNNGRPCEIALLHPDFQSPKNIGMNADERWLAIFLHGLQIETLSPSGDQG